VVRPRIATRLLVAVLLLLGFPFTAAEDAKRKELDDLRTRIRDTVTDRQRLQSDADNAKTDLRTQELALAEAERRLTEIRQTIIEKYKRLEAVTEQSTTELSALASERERLAQLLRAHYALGREDSLKLVLSQEDPQRLSRILTYHDLHTRARVQQVAAAGKRLRDSALIAESTRLEMEKLQYLENEQGALVEKVRRLRAAREQTIAAIAGKISERNRALEQLREDKRALEKLLYSLPGDAVGTAPSVPGGKGIKDQKGELAWPTTGHVVREFDDTASTDSELPLHGVLIEASPGSSVRAVSDGRVAFADWFQGFGLLLIIDHGDDYISLYGHNQSLARKAGDSVKRGEVIATVGDSGGQQRSGLYFAIRHRGKPLDPVLWCR
jgi:septal ring factor EnvC (AmiA/AmiB activator)